MFKDEEIENLTDTQLLYALTDDPSYLTNDELLEELLK